MSEPNISNISKPEIENTNILNSLKSGVENLNTKFDCDDWNQIEISVSQFEKDVLTCLKDKQDATEQLYQVIGETLYMVIRPLINTKFKLIQINNTNKKTTAKEDKPKKQPKKGCKSAQANTMSKAHEICKNNTIKMVNDNINLILNSFGKDKMTYEYGLMTNKILELRGISFMYMAWFVLESHPEEYIKKSKITEIYELICSMQRFINTCTEYYGISLSNSLQQIVMSPTSIDDLTYWLDELKEKYVFNGITIYNNAPKLLIYSQYDDCIPSRGICIRPNQKSLLNTIEQHYANGFLLFYNAFIGSGKTTLASVGISSYLETLKKNGKMKPHVQMIFCCNLPSVRKQVARNCWNSGIKFGIASYIKATGGYKITNHWGTTDDTRSVIIASPEVTALILEEDSNKVTEDRLKPMKERKYVTNNYWLFLDEPTVGADIYNSRYLNANTKVLCFMPQWTILSSATMPVPTKLNSLIAYHKNKFPDVHVDLLITKEITIGCNVMTYDSDIVVPHQKCKTKHELLECIRKIDEIPFLGRLYTYNVVHQLWENMKDNFDICNVPEFFSDVDNLSSNTIKCICIELLNKLSESDDGIIKQICGQSCLSDSLSDKQSNDKQRIQFEKIGTCDAIKYTGMTLMVSNEPVNVAKQCFTALLDDVSEYGIDITRIRNYISQYKSKLTMYEKNRKDLAHSLDIDVDSEEFNIDQVRKSSQSQSKSQLKDQTGALTKEQYSTLTKNMNGSNKDFDMSRKLSMFEELATKKGCGIDQRPVISFPMQFQVNTPQHWKRYGKDTAELKLVSTQFRQPLDIAEIMQNDYCIDDWIIFLLFCGVGIYSPFQINDDAYLKEVLRLSELGRLSYLISDMSICYGTNYPINRVIVFDDFASTYSINTLFQLMGRAGRVGQSWKADVFVHENTANKILEFVHDKDSNSGNIEAENITKTFDDMIIDVKRKHDMMVVKEKEKEEQIIRIALEKKQKLEELARKKILEQKQKVVLPPTNQFGHSGGYNNTGHSGGYNGGYNNTGHSGGYNNTGHSGGYNNTGHNGGYNNTGHNGGYNNTGHNGGYNSGYNNTGHGGGYNGEYNGGYNRGYNREYNSGHTVGYNREYNRNINSVNSTNTDNNKTYSVIDNTTNNVNTTHSNYHDKPYNNYKSNPVLNTDIKEMKDNKTHGYVPPWKRTQVANVVVNTGNNMKPKSQTFEEYQKSNHSR